eukprot:365700-Chlamydomonas_euryale.AAC.14
MQETQKSSRGAPAAGPRVCVGEAAGVDAKEPTAVGAPVAGVKVACRQPPRRGLLGGGAAKCVQRSACGRACARRCRRLLAVDASLSPGSRLQRRPLVEPGFRKARAWILAYQETVHEPGKAWG